MEKIYASFYKSDKGAFALIWHTVPEFKLLKLFLEGRESLKEQINFQYPAVFSGVSAKADELSVKIRKCLDFSNNNLPADKLEISSLGNFKKKILLTLRENVPPGKVISYAKLAEKAGYAKAARATGTAMSSNPFPLFFPCHRVVKSDRGIGNFGPGVELKRYLLGKEGVGFDTKGNVLEKYFIE